VLATTTSTTAPTWMSAHPAIVGKEPLHHSCRHRLCRLPSLLSSSRGEVALLGRLLEKLLSPSSVHRIGCRCQLQPRTPTCLLLDSLPAFDSNQLGRCWHHEEVPEGDSQLARWRSSWPLQWSSPLARPSPSTPVTSTDLLPWPRHVLPS
jgi:hypothetical protein